MVFACGRYEGIDQRVVEDAEQRYRVEEVSIGDYVLIGGEVAVLVMAEAMVRLIPGVLGNRASHEEDSFQDGLLEGQLHSPATMAWAGRTGSVAQWQSREDRAMAPRTIATANTAKATGAAGARGAQQVRSPGFGLGLTSRISGRRLGSR